MVIDKNTLIADQALKIAILEASHERKVKALQHIHGVLVCIGGPLNDNVKRYTHEQLSDFFAIQEYINEA